MSACPAPDDLTSLALRHLDGAEAARLQAHVDRCPACQELVATWTDLLGQLPMAETPSAPPPDLKRRIMAALPAEPQPATRSTPNRFALRWVGLVATFALLLGGYAIWRVERLSPHTIQLSGVGPGQGAKAQVALFTEGSGTRVAVTATGLPPLAPDEVYQLWLIKGGERSAVCAFKVDSDGHGETTYWLPGKLAYDGLGVTREPDAHSGYSKQPRGPKVLGS